MEQQSFESGNKLEQEIQALFDADQKDREENLLQTNPELLKERDKVRYEKAARLFKQYIQNPELFSGEMKFNLALLFQHGVSTEDYEKALKLAQAAEQDGFGGAETLVRVAEDRYLLSIGEPQKWGTQLLKE